MCLWAAILVLGLLLADAAPLRAEVRTAAGAETGAYADVAAWGTVWADTAARDGRFRLFGSASLGNGLKRRVTAGKADSGYSWRSSGGALVCRGELCGGPIVRWSGYRSEWADGVVWEKDNVRPGAALRWRHRSTEVWLIADDSNVSADVWIMLSAWGMRARFTSQDEGGGAVLAQVVRRF